MGATLDTGVVLGREKIMTKGIAVPGAIYSALIALSVWCADYFTSGDGSASIIAPLIVAAVPILLKLVTVQSTEPPAEPMARGMSATPPSKVNRFLLG